LGPSFHQKPGTPRHPRRAAFEAIIRGSYRNAFD
jgi:hypothetical protein